MNTINIQFDGDPYEFVHKYVQTHNLRHYGSGAFSSVYVYRNSQKHKRVVKIIVLPVENIKNDAYLAYLKQVVLKQQDNPFVPHIYNVEAYRILNTKTKEKHLIIFIEMERLHYIKIHMFKRLIKKVLPSENNNQGEYYQIFLTYRDLIRAAASSQNKYFRSLSKQLLRLLCMFELDLHEGNIMFRRKGRGYQLVITDPVS